MIQASASAAAVLILALSWEGVGRVEAQQVQAAKAEASPPAGGAESAGIGDFAPGVLTVIEPGIDRADAISLHDMVEIRADEKLKWEPSSTTRSRTLYEMAHNAAYPQQVWGLEIDLKPLRMIEVDVPQTGGAAERKLIWYLVYRVRNTGAALDAVVRKDGTFSTKKGQGKPVRFLPQFVLASQDRTKDGAPVRKAYLDRVIPAAMEAIQRRELPGGELLGSVEMAQQTLPVEPGRASRGRWGVAMWEDVDPEMDFFSIFVGGLTNAYQWTDPAGAYQAGDPPGKGRKFARKTLQLNYWRPGDELEQNEREIRFGAAPGKADLYDSGEGVAYRWVYR